ncbi:efflux RND transporter periplasmic adaptor subunit [Oleisolibacter albus]|uniref:efflux RND transporter periplasmic adaptor subunit n=1 Tax=Oleisolibacter albus TaxID=2171757 RepID=UPI000DF32FDB|nr:efflux RND transporter periplasmic adaptor subunit [Oleisolibacter albus]
MDVMESALGRGEPVVEVPPVRPRRLRLPDRAGLRARLRRWRRGLVALGILLAGISGLAVLVASKPEVPREARPERVWSVDAIPAAAATHQPQISLLGTMQPGRTVELRALVGGTVVAVSPALRNGGVVRAGDLLLQVEPLDYELALAETRAGLAEARARLDELRATSAAEKAKLQFARQQLDLRERDLTRSQQLFEKGTIAAPRLEQAQVAMAQERQSFTAAQNDVAAGEARVRQQEAAVQRLEAQLGRAEADLARTRLVAPFDGFVGRVGAEQGMRLSPADRVAELSGAEGLEAQVTLSTEAYGRLAAESSDGRGVIGRPARVVWTLGSTPLVYPARVERVVDRLDTASGGVTLFVRLEGSVLDQPLRPGAFVQVEIPDRAYAAVVRLPVTALHEGGRVYVVGAGDRLEARPVTVAASSADSVYVADGLAAGDRVVTTRFQEIAPGIKVALRGAAPEKAVAGEVRP